MPFCHHTQRGVIVPLDFCIASLGKQFLSAHITFFGMHLYHTNTHLCYGAVDAQQGKCELFMLKQSRGKITCPPCVTQLSKRDPQFSLLTSLNGSVDNIPQCYGFKHLLADLISPVRNAA